jgi:hypothetical protein
LIFLVLDYVLWNTQAFGWHFDTLLSFFAACCLSGLVAFELLKPAWSIRSAAFAGILTTLFMILYPGHPDSVVTIVGQQESLATTFILCSLYLYVLSKRSHSWSLLPLSIGSFVLGLGSKEIAVTLPVVLFMGELLEVFGVKEHTKGWQSRFMTALSTTGPFWLALMIFTCLRTIFVHSLVGGYGKIKLLTIFDKLQIFGDLESLKRIFVPINGHFPPPDILVSLLICLYAYPLLRLAFRSYQNPRFRHVVLFFFLFAVINVLPTF